VEKGRVPEPRWKARIDDLRARMRDRRLDALVLSDLPNIRYICGFSGTNGLLAVTPRHATLLTDPRYRDQARREARNASVAIVAGSLSRALPGVVRFAQGARVGYEEDVLTVARFATLKSALRGVSFVRSAGIVEEAAAVKDASEIACIAEAARIADRVYAEVLPAIRPGMTELEIAARISASVRMNGGDGDAFDIIVSSGAQSAFPHARASRKKLERGDLVIMDFGARYRGYHSDITRTIAVGRLDARRRSMVEAVTRAHDEAVDAVRAGVPAREVDAVAREIIGRAGFGRAFIHSLGHGVGLRIHERPRVAALSSEILASGNVMTIEPGVYLPGIGGVRIEDDVLVRDRGCTLLTRAPRDVVIV
jgi:Xaa-Pro aminopeptidase